MYEEYKDRQRRDMWKSIPFERMVEIQYQIMDMKPSRDRKVLELAFVHGLTTAEIVEVAKNSEELMSRNHRPLSKRRIQQIILIYVPDANAYQDHSQKEGSHKDHGYFATRHTKERCANCGGTERLEWHHMIPAVLGGTAEPENMICLCHECHKCVTAYHRKLFPNLMNAYKNSKKKSQK